MRHLYVVARWIVVGSAFGAVANLRAHVGKVSINASQNFGQVRGVYCWRFPSFNLSRGKNSSAAEVQALHFVGFLVLDGHRHGDDRGLRTLQNLRAFFLPLAVGRPVGLTLKA